MCNRQIALLMLTSTVALNAMYENPDNDYVLVSGAQTKAVAEAAQRRVKAISDMKGLYWDADDKTLDALNSDLIREASSLSNTYGSWAVNNIPKNNFSLKNVAFKNSIPGNTPQLRQSAYANLTDARIALYDDRNKAILLAKKKTTNSKFQVLRAEIEGEFSTLIQFVEHIMTALLVFEPGLVA